MNCSALHGLEFCEHSLTAPSKDIETPYLPQFLWPVTCWQKQLMWNFSKRASSWPNPKSPLILISVSLVYWSKPTWASAACLIAVGGPPGSAMAAMTLDMKSSRELYQLISHQLSTALTTKDFLKAVRLSRLRTDIKRRNRRARKVSEIANFDPSQALQDPAEKSSEAFKVKDGPQGHLKVPLWISMHLYDTIMHTVPTFLSSDASGPDIAQCHCCADNLCAQARLEQIETCRAWLGLSAICTGSTLAHGSNITNMTSESTGTAPTCTCSETLTLISPSSRGLSIGLESRCGWTQVDFSCLEWGNGWCEAGIPRIGLVVLEACLARFG